jgi:hypothetical protein
MCVSLGYIAVSQLLGRSSMQDSATIRHWVPKVIDVDKCNGCEKQFSTYVRLRTEPIEFEGKNTFCAQQPSEEMR